jgi:hypothetical protein
MTEVNKKNPGRMGADRGNNLSDLESTVPALREDGHDRVEARGDCKGDSRGEKASCDPAGVVARGEPRSTEPTGSSDVSSSRDTKGRGWEGQVLTRILANDTGRSVSPADVGQACAGPRQVTDRGQRGLQIGKIGDRKESGCHPTGSFWLVPATKEEVERILAQIWWGSCVEDFVAGAVERNNDSFEYWEENSPREGEYRSSCWWLVSILRKHPEFAELSPWGAVAKLDIILESLGGWRLLPQHDLFENPTNPRDDFIDTWLVVEKPLHLPIDPAAAIPLADQYPLKSERWVSHED